MRDFLRGMALGAVCALLALVIAALTACGPVRPPKPAQPTPEDLAAAVPERVFDSCLLPLDQQAVLLGFTRCQAVALRAYYQSDRRRVLRGCVAQVEGALEALCETPPLP